MGIPAILACATEEQKKRLLPLIIKDGALTWELFTEPEAGSDEANQQTNALRSVREKDYFIVNGGKIFVGGLYPPPDLFLLLTRTVILSPSSGILALISSARLSVTNSSASKRKIHWPRKGTLSSAQFSWAA